MHRRRVLEGLFVSFCLLWAWSVRGDPLMYRPGREHRTINTDRYEVSVQKNGRTDVFLMSRAPVFANAFPMVWYEGEPEAEPLPINGQLTERLAINDALGEGQGIHFVKGNTEWLIHGYPTKSFLTAQVAFVNTTKKPIKIKALIPWAVGKPREGGLTLGPGTSDCVLLNNGGLTQLDPKLDKLAPGESITSLWNVALFNPTTNRSLIAGLLSNTHGYTQVRLARLEKAKDDILDFMRAECVYDPPIELQPNERLESEPVYLAVDETNPLEGLERFAAAVGVLNKHKPTRAALPHGWDSWNTKYKFDINEENMLASLNFIDARLKRYGWTHFSLDAGWELGKGNWEPNPEKFPHGMKWFVDQVHQRGMTAGIWVDPFTVNVNTPLAKEHPDWLVAPVGLGKSMLADDERILDVTVPEAKEYVKALFKKIAREWGFDALVEADFVYHLMFAEKFADAKVTRVEALRVGMTAIREGIGPGKFLMSMPPLPVTGVFVDGARIGSDCAPVWSKSDKSWAWGCVDTLTNAAHRYYFSPHVWYTDQDCAYFGHEDTRQRWGVTEAPPLTWEQSVAWLTGAALTGGALKIGDAFTDLSDKEVAVLSKLLPTPEKPARPIDMFERPNPAIWSLPISCPIGQWEVVGIFNWDAGQSQKLSVDFRRLGLAESGYYTVYDFWQDKYYGVAQGNLTVDVAPGSVRLLGLRRVQQNPMFLATDRHFTQGATDFTALKWDAATRMLSATFTGVADTDYNLRVLVPEGYTMQKVSTSAGQASTEMDGQVLKIGFHNAQPGPVNWAVQF